MNQNYSASSQPKQLVLCSHHIFEKLCMTDSVFLDAVKYKNSEKETGPYTLDFHETGTFTLNDLITIHKNHPHLFKEIKLF